MTSVYGVTFVGARMQIQNRLKERGALPNEKLRYEVACYAAKQTIASLRDMFSNARAVMDWLTGCAMVISNAGETVRWRTPLGLPVVQPYRTRSKALVRTVLQTFSLQSEDETRPVTKAKQRSAFPPNFIHSVDSSHMMLTAIGCHEAGLTFAGVHDSFWTHAASCAPRRPAASPAASEAPREPGPPPSSCRGSLLTSAAWSPLSRSAGFPR